MSGEDLQKQKQKANLWKALEAQGEATVIRLANEANEKYSAAAIRLDAEMIRLVTEHNKQNERG